MHCYACDKLLNNPELDGVTGRYYCSECFEPTIVEQFRLANKEYIRPFVFETEEVSQEKPQEKWTESDENDSSY